MFLRHINENEPQWELMRVACHATLFGHTGVLFQPNHEYELFDGSNNASPVSILECQLPLNLILVCLNRRTDMTYMYIHTFI